MPVAQSSPRGDGGSTPAIRELVGAFEIVAGTALLILAVILFVVGSFESTWSGRADVWALALFAAVTGGPMVADGYRRLRGGRLLEAVEAEYRRVRPATLRGDEPNRAGDPRPEPEPSRPHPAVRRLVLGRTGLMTICVLLLLTVIGDVRTAPAPDGQFHAGLPRATGDLVLLREPEQVTVVVPLVGGGVASCSLLGGRWSGEWSPPRIDPDWGELGRSSGLFSVFETIQLLGQVGGGLVQGRYEDHRWHGQYPVTLRNQDQLIVDARGRPAFFQHVTPDGDYGTYRREGEWREPELIRCTDGG